MLTLPYCKKHDLPKIFPCQNFPSYGTVVSDLIWDALINLSVLWTCSRGLCCKTGTEFAAFYEAVENDKSNEKR